MTLSAFDVARMRAHDRPGLEILGFEEVALPFFRLTLEALVQERKPIPVIEEFVLRAIASELQSIDQISGFLGLEMALVEQAVVDQWHLDNVDYRRAEGDETSRLRLTDAGLKVLNELEMLIPERREISVGFDRLKWEVAPLEEPEMLRPIEARDQGLREIPSRFARRPEIKDLSVDKVSRLIRTVGIRRLESVDLLALRGIVRAERAYRKAVLLIFGKPGQGDLQVAVAVDGRISEPHEAALGELGGAGRLGISYEEDPDAKRNIAALEDEPGVASRLDPRQQEVAQKLGGVERQLADMAYQRSTQPGDDAPALSPDLLISERVELQRQINEFSVRRLEVYDHPPLLDEALSSSQERLLILSPWITAAVVDEDFQRRLEALCRSNIPVHIGYGLDDPKRPRPQRTKDKNAERALHQMSTRYENFICRRLGDTHAKILIWDGRSITTSFNWLSFRGDPDRTFRREEGLFVGIREKVDELYKEYVAVIESG